MKSFFKDEKQVANLPPVFKTPEQVKKENSEFPTKYEIFLNSEMEKLNSEFFLFENTKKKRIIEKSK